MASAINNSAIPETVTFSDTEMQLILSDGTEIKTPLSDFPRLNEATRAQRENWMWMGNRDGIHWPDIDEDLSTHHLIRNSRQLSDPIFQIPFLIADLFRITDHLEKVFKRPFTPDGHLVGSIGEIVAQHVYDLELEPCSTPQADAKTRDGRTVEIKLTRRDSFAFSWSSTSSLEAPDLLICLKLDDAGFTEVYNGAFPIAMLREKKDQRNGQVRLSENKLRMAMKSTTQSLPQVNSLSDFNRYFERELDSAA
jgi:hypothetical protein